MPSERAPLWLGEVYTLEEFESIRYGFLPGQMEDKWFIFYEDSWLYLHRSWTGYCIFALKFEPLDDGFAIIESWVNTDPRQYGERSLPVNQWQARHLVQTLIDYEPLHYYQESSRVLSANAFETHSKKTRTFRFYSVSSGMLTLDVKGEVLILGPGDQASISEGQTFRLSNEGTEPVLFLERIDGLTPVTEENL